MSLVAGDEEKDDGSCVEKSFEIGATVVISGLKAKPELNGTRGTVVKKNEGGDRWIVKCKATGVEIALKPASLREVFHFGAAAVTAAVTAAPERQWPTAMNALPGVYKADYDWRKVGPGQELPKGLETMVVRR